MKLVWRGDLTPVSLAVLSNSQIFLRGIGRGHKRVTVVSDIGMFFLPGKMI
jgi:hypothetical protein